MTSRLEKNREAARKSRKRRRDRQKFLDTTITSTLSTLNMERMNYLRAVDTSYHRLLMKELEEGYEHVCSNHDMIMIVLKKDD